MKHKIYYILIFSLILASCRNEKTKSDVETIEKEFVYGDEINLNELLKNIKGDSKLNVVNDSLMIGNSIPTTRVDLEGMRTVVKIFDGKTNAGISIPGFGGLTLEKKQSNMNVYYLETKVVETENDTTVYGIGYSIHYLFNKVKRGVDVKNLASVAASAQLESSKTSVSYSLQSYGMRSNALAKFFKPQVNGDFDVNGYGIIQSNIDGIQNVLVDSLLASRTKFTPEKLYFLSAKDLRN